MKTGLKTGVYIVGGGGKGGGGKGEECPCYLSNIIAEIIIIIDVSLNFEKIL